MLLKYRNKVIIVQVASAFSHYYFDIQFEAVDESASEWF